MNPLLHTSTEHAFATYLQQPSHALLLVAPTGAGKATAARHLAGQLLGTDPTRLSTHPYFKIVRPEDGKTITVDSIRSLTHFTALRATGDREVSRVAIIEDAHLMNTQAQNALLKTIEEPPAGTVLILTAAHELALLPTIRSRVQQLSLHLPETQALLNHFQALGHSEAAARKALLMSGGLPGLMQALLDATDDHPLLVAAQTARLILQKTTFERLVLADELGKDRQLTQDTLFMLQQMASVALQQNHADRIRLKRWHHIAVVCQLTAEQLRKSAQPKLALTSFMLTL